jgi:hypothetical protein
MARHGFPRWLSRLLSRPGSRGGAEEKPSDARLEIESLEPRWVLSWVPLDLLTAELFDSSPQANAEFGWSIAVDGDTLVVGVPRQNYAPDDFPLAGAAYVYTRDDNGTADVSDDGWILQDTLTALDPAEGDLFGFSVAISGDTIVVGSYKDDDDGSNSGSAYVFARSGATWSHLAKLKADDAAASDNFGFSVAISGDTIVVGSLFDDVGGADSGSSYVFVRSGTTWSQQAKLNASDRAARDHFGSSVAIDGDTIVVGSNQDDDDGDLSGSAYVFVRGGTAWSQQQKLLAGDAAAGDEFGGAVAIDGDTIVVGSAFGADAGNALGSSYVFVRTGSDWTEQAKLRASDAAADNRFGRSVAIDGDTIVVGSPLDDDGGFASGSAYVFVRSGNAWTEQAKLTASHPEAGDLFGGAVAIDGDTIVVGSYADGLEFLPRAGSVSTFVFEDSTPPTVVTQNFTLYLDIDGNGTISVDDVDGGSTDNVAIASRVLDITSFTTDDVGANIVTLTVTDTAGNSASSTATVTVVDNIPPTVITRDITIYLDATGNATVYPSDIDNGSSDAAGIRLRSAGPAFFTGANLGPNTVTLTATDRNNNTASGTAIVTVADNIAPTAVAQNITVYLDTSGNATITGADINNGSTDNAGIDSLALDVTSFTGADLGDNTVTLTVSDASGNSSTASATVTVIDNLAPIASAQNFTAFLNAAGTVSITASDIDNGSTDNVAIDSLSLDVTSFTVADLGENTVTLTVTDTSGNVSTASAIVTVADNIAPTIVVPGDIVVQATSVSGASVSFAASATDNADSDVVITYSVDGVPVISGATFAVGVHVVTVEATDDSGNTSTGEFTITVEGNSAISVTHWVHVTSQGASLIEIMDAETGEVVSTIDPFPGFSGGLNVASGDLDGDGISEIIVGAKAGGGPHVKVYSSDGIELRSFFAYEPAFTGGVTVAIGDINDDGWGDIITGAGPGGGPHVKVFSGLDGTVLQSFYAFDPAFTGGVHVAAGDVNADDHADVIVGAGPGGGPHVKAFSGSDQSLLASFYAYDPAFSGGVRVAAGDVNGDLHADIITGAGAGGGPHVQVFDGANLNLLQSLFAFDSQFAGGVHVAAGDVDGDDLADIITSAGPGGGPHVRAFSGLTGTELASYFAYEPTMTSGVQVVGAELHSGDALRAFVGVRRSTAAALTSTLLTSSVSEALHQLQTAGLSPTSQQYLSDLRYEIADLPGTLLAQFDADLIRVDVNAAGHGWWTDLALPDPARIDLLTTLAHEFGHALGLEHADDPSDLMAETLTPGVRKTDWADIVERVFAQA